MDTEPWKKPAKANIFFDMEKFEALVDELMKSMFAEPTAEAQKKPVVFGFSVKMDAGGKAHIEEFGNVKAKAEGFELSNAREPLVDVIDSEGEATITAELPGVENKDVSVRQGEGSVIISVNTPGREFYKEVQLGADASTIKTSLKNGILEIRVSKKPQTKGADRK